MRDFIYELARGVEEHGNRLTKFIFFGSVAVIRLLTAILLFPFKLVWGLCQVAFAFFAPWFEPDRAFSTGLLIGLLCPVLLIPVILIATFRKWRDRQDPVWYNA